MAMAERHKKARGGEGPDQERSSGSGGGAEWTSCSGRGSGGAFPNLLEKFTIEAQIGDGGQGMVHRVRRISDGRLFAAKTVRIGENAPDLVRQEVQIMERLRTCSLIGAPVLEEVIVDSGFWHIVLELCACSLHDRIQLERGLSQSESALLVRDLARTVQRLHDVGVVHRDLKPPNVLLTAAAPPYEVRVADFGLSVSVPPGGTPLCGSVGTPKYLAPEVVRGLGYGPAVDVWGLGLILYEAVSGKVAYAGLESEFVMERLGWVDHPAGMLDWSGVGDEVKDLILGMLCLDPGKRLTTGEIQQHPWVVKHTQQSENEARSVEQEEFVPRTPSRVVKLRRLNGRWVSDRVVNCDQQKPQQQQQKRKKIEQGPERKKLRLRCVNGLWQVEKQQCTAAVVA